MSCNAPRCVTSKKRLRGRLGNNGCIFFRVLSFSQPDSLIPSLFNAYFTTNYQPAFEKYYWIFVSSRTTPATRPGFISFYLHAVKQSRWRIYTANKISDLRRASIATSWNSIEQSTQFTWSILNYFVYLSNSLLCPCVSTAATLWNESRAGIRPW